MLLSIVQCLSSDCSRHPQGRVYEATRLGSNQVVALKKSRASLTLKSTLLNHERLLLQRLQGHPSIPKVFAYGRLKHFEYLAMESLGMALDDVHERRPYLPPVNILMIADQMVCRMSTL
jgi:serine/threonine protein kinase